MKKILVTGAYGFVGSNIAEDFARSNIFSTIALDVSEVDKSLYNTYYSWKQIDNIEWDCLDTIIHSAGKAHDTKNSSNPESYIDINYGLTKIVYDKFVRSKAEKFIYFSSIKAVADTVEGEYLAEEFLPNPKTPYGMSKLRAEHYILEHKLTAGKQVYILRPCMIHGPRNKGNLNLLFDVIKKGIPYPLGKFNNLRSFTSIDNLTFIVRELIEKCIEPGVYHVCDDEPVSTNELVELIAQSCHRKGVIVNIPQKIIHAIAAAGDLLHLPLNSERLKKLTESYVVSNNKLKLALGIDRLPLSARDGLIHTFNSFANR